MDFISVTYLVSFLLLIIVYYMVPKNRQWISLLVFSIIFYSLFSLKMWIFMLLCVVTTYLFAKYKNDSKLWLIMTILLNTGSLIVLKLISSDLGIIAKTGLSRFAFIVPVGISFYTLQSIAYIVDVYQKKIEPERNFFRYLLFMIYFPQILQGPIPRFKQLSEQLFKGAAFSEEKFLSGFYLMLWGFFQKMVVADRCNIVVNHIFDRYTSYEGAFLLLAGILYSIQLYADFAGCVCIATGCSQMLSIDLAANFDHPYFAVSIKDFWRKWHISLSSFLRDYIYIPLGGNRKGKVRKYINILLTFLVSGIWHGMGLHFVVWGLLHGVYQVLGELLQPVKDFFVKVTGTERESITHIFISRLFTFFLVMIAWVFFRAESLSKAIYIVIHMFTKFNPWIFVSGELYTLGINEEETVLLIGAFVLMFIIAFMHEKKIEIRKVFMKQPLFFRWGVLLTFIFVILITGIYGPTYDSAQFIYGGF